MRETISGGGRYLPRFARRLLCGNPFMLRWHRTKMFLVSPLLVQEMAY